MKKYAIIGREPERSERVRSELVTTFHDLEVLSIPFITIAPVPFELPNPEKTPLFLFTSPRSVEVFFRSVPQLPKGAYVASIGYATAKTLCNMGIEPHFIGSTENSKSLAPELLQYIGIQSLRFHVIQPTSNIAGRYLDEFFNSRGIEYTRLVTYDVLPDPSLKDRLSQLSGNPEWVLFYSPGGVEAWTAATDMRPLAFAIGPVTAEKLRSTGWDKVYESETPHEIDIIRTIVKNYI